MCDCFGRCRCNEMPRKVVSSAAAARNTVPQAYVDNLHERLMDVARRLKREIDAIHAECEVQRKAGLDYTDLWARSGGMFFAYKDLCDILGWQ